MKIKQFLQKAKNPIVVVLGPTASGKTALSLRLAQKFNGEIISTDSRQIYKGMDIGTDILPKSYWEGISHHLLSITTPDMPITLAEYKDLASQKIKEIHTRAKLPILVGGTGLYISAIIENYQIPRIAPDKKLREKLNQEAETKGMQYLYDKLKKLDPKKAKTIHPNNLRYVIRALEIAMKGKTKTATKKAPYDVFMVGIEWPREELYKRIEKRVQNQIQRGLTDEVKKLLKKGYNDDLPAMSSLGVKEIIPFLKGEKSIEECTEILKRNTRRYAKRQMTWFRRYDNVLWLKPEELKKI